MTPDPLDTTDPRITAATVACDVQATRWSFQVVTDAWTGAGRVTLSADGEYVEQHSLPSTSAAADGTSDTLERDLAIVATWRDAIPDSSTAFACDTAALSGVFSVYSRDGSALTACLAFGEDTGRWQSWDPTIACETVMEGDQYPTAPTDTSDSGDTGGSG